ncbi:MAG: phage terminase large subunit family protein, partial [Magnetospiraceae bacterium]
MSFDTAAWADGVWRRGIAPEPLLTVSEWADQHRYLSELSAETGPWRTDRVPYLRQIMDCLSTASPIERVVFQKGAQLGGTEAGLNWCGYVIAHAPGTLLMVMPSIEMIRRNSTTRIDPLIESTPALRELIAPARSRDSGNSTTRKKFPGGVLIMTGANSATGLRSTPARYLFLDEVDAFPADADGEGDPVALAVQRTVTFRGRRKILLVSTPTIKGFSRIETAYLESDQRRYFVPCNECGAFQTIDWAQIRWPEGRRDQAYFACRECGAVHDEHQKFGLLAKGEWRATAAGDGRTAGFHLSSLYSPFESWAEIAIEHGLVRKDPPRLKTWCNTKLGETWEDPAAAQVDESALMARRESWDLLPARIVALTAGVDVQDDRLEVQLIGWARDFESWVIDYAVIHGDPATPSIWDDLDAALRRTWPHERQVADMGIRAAAVDSGGHHTAAVYHFCGPRLSRRVWAIKGRAGEGQAPWPRTASKVKGRVAPLFIVGVDGLKDALAGRLKVEEPGPGMVHFPVTVGPDYFAQLVAERAVTKFEAGRPRRVWMPKTAGARNEALDTFVYASAALHGLAAAGFNLNREALALERYPLKADDRQVMPT